MKQAVGRLWLGASRLTAVQHNSGPRTFSGRPERVCGTGPMLRTRTWDWGSERRREVGRRSEIYAGSFTYATGNKQRAQSAGSLPR